MMSEPLYVHPDGVRSYAQVHDEVVATGTSGSTISELLQKAAQMYEHGDQKRAATLRAATEALEGLLRGRVHRDRLGLLPTRQGRQALARQVRAAATRSARSSARWDSRPDSSARWPSR